VVDLLIGGHIRIPKTAEILASRIRKAIIRGELKAGDSLPAEAALITDFEVSRPTIREAIRILESEGLITVARGARGGARINAATNEFLIRAAGIALQANGATIRDVFEVRTIIEPPAAGLAAAMRSDKAIGTLRDCLAREKAQLDNGVRPTALVAEFHGILLEECGNVALAMVGQALYDLVEHHLKLAARKAPKVTQAQMLKRARVGLRSHERLIELIAAGDSAEAKAHWVRHMLATGKVLLAEVGDTAVMDVLD